MLEYSITAHSNKGGEAYAKANNGIVKIDASAGKIDELPNPAELLLTSLAACMLKNVERFSEILKFDYSEAQVEIKGFRNDVPPFMSEIHYVLKVKSDMDERKLQLLHKNILKFGTITNTLAKASELKGTIAFLH
ncbi:MAG TPA: osmotically inducible protein C [Flavobacteriales bacterium]|nr:osmotically inducible protein C [Flavobacteriales bacterium]|tara:strand:- start:67933 stop:68337 length:405 start_codon:yes stop_codon:yes gene_type:complete